MPVLFFSEYRPDVSDYEGNSSKNITNVVPRGDGYGPVPNLSAFTTALPSTCFGSFAARKTDGSISIFAGTATDLYQLDNTTGTWVLVSRGGGYNALFAGAIWQFAQFNNIVFATQQNDILQHLDISTPGLFANAADSNTPQAAYITVVNSFLVLSGIAPPNVYRIQWSGLNDVLSAQSFTSGINSSDFQDLADGGIVHGVSGGEYGVIFQDTSIRRLLYAPGSPFVFQIDRIAVDNGLLTPYSLIRAGNNIFWLGPTGFQMLPPGGVPTPIGKERVDRTFTADCDFTHPELLIGSNDPTHTRVWWAYKSVGNSMSTADKVLVYDWALDRWTLIGGGGYSGITSIAPLGKPSLSLEGVDSAFGTGAKANITAVTTAATGSVFTADEPTQLTAGMGVQVTVSATTTSTLPAVLVPAKPYYIAASNLTTTTFSLTTSGGIGTAVTSTTGSVGTTVLVTVPATLGTSALRYAIEPIETINLGTLDSISNVSQIALAAVSTAGTFGFFNGPALEATLETPEQGGDGQRIFNRGFRIVSDVTTGMAFGSASYREGPQAAYRYTKEDDADIRGSISLRISTRYTRNKVRIPQATTWSYAAGVEADNVPDGKR